MISLKVTLGASRSDESALVPAKLRCCSCRARRRKFLFAAVGGEMNTVRPL
jgi:hypothetical protein